MIGGGVATDPVPGLVAGMLLKGLYSSLLEEFRVRTAVWDIGLQYEVADAMKLGIAAQNLGAQIRYSEDTFSLPAAVRAGLAYGFRIGEASSGGDAVLVASDIGYLSLDRAFEYRMGVEYRWRSLLDIRIGMHAGSAGEPGTLCIGFGVNGGRMGAPLLERFDYAIQFWSRASAYPQTLSLTAKL